MVITIALIPLLASFCTYRAVPYGTCASKVLTNSTKEHEPLPR